MKSETEKTNEEVDWESLLIEANILYLSVENKLCWLHRKKNDWNTRPNPFNDKDILSKFLVAYKENNLPDSVLRKIKSFEDIPTITIKEENVRYAIG